MPRNPTYSDSHGPDSTGTPARSWGRIFDGPDPIPALTVAPELVEPADQERLRDDLDMARQELVTALDRITDLERQNDQLRDYNAAQKSVIAAGGIDRTKVETIARELLAVMARRR